ncbi:AMP-binding protein [Pseudonocardia sp. MH-G8]|uniref:AMP-binding protein n=1 Tax=Pseudonocardia sp. MH-G8 TaxID=1854588 RepID=UPI000BA0B180|nr:AMP-binding protein [Pseudonocardia sp. MH-G8]OZM79708.1 acyl-CoA synthetase [Pseudonocardia sp. MH-G8]
MSDAAARLDLLTRDGDLATERLDHWAATTPDAVFVHYGDDGTDLTYAGARRTTDAIAGNLAARGITRGARISVFSADPFATTSWMFGIWKAGAVYCPVNFAFTGRLLAYQLNDTAPAAVVVDADLVPALEAVRADLVDPPMVIVLPGPRHEHGFAEIGHAELLAPAAAPDVPLTFDDVANVIYTSGTTGAPKGVVQPHRWMNQYTYTLRSVLTPQDVVYTDLPMYHVGGAIANVVRACWVGAGVSMWDRFSPHEFWHRVRSTNATTAILLDVMIPWLTNAPERSDDRANPLKCVHMQPLPLGHHRFARRFGIDFVTAGFGQSESGAPLAAGLEEVREGEGTPPEHYRGRTHAQMREVCRRNGLPLLAGDQVDRKGFMGRPTPFFEAAVLDERDTPCPPGVPGQLALRPRLPGLVLREYLGRPAATAAAFANLWFHTGDAAVQDADGDFCFLDRMGDRIRVRGENLSSAQVEDVLGDHPDVGLAAAFAVPGAEGDEDDVVVYLQPEDGHTVDPEEVSRWCVPRMPKFMRPRHVRVIGEIPRTPTNKIEKYRLRQAFLGEGGSGAAGA